MTAALLIISICLCLLSIWHVQQIRSKAKAEYLAQQARISECNSLIQTLLNKINSRMDAAGMQKGQHIERAHIEGLLNKALKAERDLGWSDGVQYQTRISNRKGGRK